MLFYFYILGIEEDFIAWKTKLLEFLSNEAGRDGVKSCPCGKDDATTGSCCQSRSDNATGVDHPLTASEDAEVSMYIVWHSTTAQSMGWSQVIFWPISEGGVFRNCCLKIFHKELEQCWACWPRHVMGF